MSTDPVSRYDAAMRAHKDAQGAATAMGCLGVVLLLATVALLLWGIWGADWRLFATGGVTGLLYVLAADEARNARQRLQDSAPPPPSVMRGGWDG